MAISSGWAHAHKVVMAKAADGFKLSELTGVYKACAIKLIDRGQLSSTILPNGDRLVNRNG